MGALKTVAATAAANLARVATVAGKTVVQVAATVVDKVVKAATQSHTRQNLLATNLNLNTKRIQWMSSKSAGTDL